MKANMQQPGIFTHVNSFKHLDIRNAKKQHRAVEYTDLCIDSSYSNDKFLNWGNPSFLPAGNHDNCELLQETPKHQDRVLRILCGVFLRGHQLTICAWSGLLVVHPLRVSLVTFTNETPHPHRWAWCMQNFTS